MLKRSFDILFSLSFLILFSPLYLLLSCLVRINSPGPSLYFHLRIGKGKLPFSCYKFRTMHLHAENKLQDILAKDPSLLREWSRYYKLKKDPRITSLGHFLRKSSLDELPQMWNVFKGDLSLVGPRPITREELDTFYSPQEQNKLLSLRPGLTGLWQISGRSELAYPQRKEVELDYIDRHNLYTDLNILFKTSLSIFFRLGAY